jgi:hypothetical protein
MEATNVIPFRQREFKNAFLEWVILDNVKYRKAVSKRLKRAFKIANIQAASSIPGHITVTDGYTSYSPILSLLLYVKSQMPGLKSQLLLTARDQSMKNYRLLELLYTLLTSITRM